MKARAVTREEKPVGRPEAPPMPWAFDKAETTAKLSDVEAEPRPELPVLPDLDAREKLVEAAGRHLRHRAHRYHGVTRADPPKAQNDVDAEASHLYRAAIKFTHAYEGKGVPCTCMFCV